ncbi:hypothetical protein JXJ21_16585 [candidate division KSB1 bacterium]|nr:hypothetical protein [candidate division KSB1 bacterium]
MENISDTCASLYQIDCLVINHTLLGDEATRIVLHCVNCLNCRQTYNELKQIHHIFKLVSGKSIAPGSFELLEDIEGDAIKIFSFELKPVGKNSQSTDNTCTWYLIVEAGSTSHEDGNFPTPDRIKLYAIQSKRMGDICLVICAADMKLFINKKFSLSNHPQQLESDEIGIIKAVDLDPKNLPNQRLQVENG